MMIPFNTLISAIPLLCLFISQASGIFSKKISGHPEISSKIV